MLARVYFASTYMIPENVFVHISIYVNAHFIIFSACAYKSSLQLYDCKNVRGGSLKQPFKERKKRNDSKVERTETYNSNSSKAVSYCLLFVFQIKLWWKLLPSITCKLTAWRIRFDDFIQGINPKLSNYKVIALLQRDFIHLGI